MNPLQAGLKLHVSLNVRDLDASVRFYRRLFDVEPVKVRPGYAKFDVQTPPVNFSLNQGSPKEDGALSHLGFQVSSTSEVLAMRDRWREAGLEPRDEMQADCCYALQDKAWVRDPDGNDWEVFVVLQDTDGSASTCCSGNSDLVSITSSQ